MAANRQEEAPEYRVERQDGDTSCRDKLCSSYDACSLILHIPLFDKLKRPLHHETLLNKSSAVTSKAARAESITQKLNTHILIFNV